MVLKEIKKPLLIEKINELIDSSSDQWDAKSLRAALIDTVKRFNDEIEPMVEALEKERNNMCQETARPPMPHVKKLVQYQRTEIEAITLPWDGTLKNGTSAILINAGDSIAKFPDNSIRILSADELTQFSEPASK